MASADGAAAAAAAAEGGGGTTVQEPLDLIRLSLDEQVCVRGTRMLHHVRADHCVACQQRCSGQRPRGRVCRAHAQTRAAARAHQARRDARHTRVPHTRAPSRCMSSAGASGSCGGGYT
jgi:hypothetical protein